MWAVIQSDAIIRQKRRTPCPLSAISLRMYAHRELLTNLPTDRCAIVSFTWIRIYQRVHTHTTLAIEEHAQRDTDAGLGRFSSDQVEWTEKLYFHGAFHVTVHSVRGVGRQGCAYLWILALVFDPVFVLVG